MSLRSRVMRGAGLVAAAGSVLLGGAAAAAADSGAQGAAVGSPGVLSGNVIQVPVDIPVNVCGNTVDVIGLLNPAFGNACVNTGM
ncbi:chaplin [Streptomyces sp. WP-1]|nr:chaplin [Streptomyces sp. WP-1]WKE74022.1 chaplin [Streptomyces sp. WP-1]